MRRVRSLVALLALFAFAVPARLWAEAAVADKPKAVIPAPQTDSWAVKWWMPRHQEKVAGLKKQEKGYRIWAEAMEPSIAKLMGEGK